MPRDVRIVVVSGPTGVGKTAVAIQLARELGGELIGADSVQVYRGFDIGASKPTAAELGGVVHHLLDVREPNHPLDAASYAALADAAIADVSARGRVPIVVGGTGLWLRALLRGLVEVPPVDAALRAELEAEWDRRGGLIMHAHLAEVDPISAARIHVNDKLRVVRALEVYRQLGKPLGSLRAQHALGAPRYRDFTLIVDLERAHHAERVRSRTRSMLEQGLIDEVRRIVARYGADLRGLQSVGYKQALEHVQHGTPLEQVESDIVRATLLYARRQRTWWRSDPSVRARLTPSAAVSGELRAQLAHHLRSEPPLEV
ncbi:MAG TPA: tRNA (adenosine(37)-N6)-dimethylallyltransferase MiaA [Polyangiales bacterium]|nr:tRNA (adenosine(37)-N6)-dimethylallyltransferase MiaA [Polyangiales bacterium]